MKKEKTITLASTEKVKVSELSEREKKIYDAGYNAGNSDVCSIIMSIIALFALAILITGS